jgi:ecotin
MKFALLTSILMSLSSSVFAEAVTPLPARMNNKDRIVINLPQVENSTDLYVELSFSQYLEFSDCNSKILTGDILERFVDADGNSYFEIESHGYISTMIGCFDEGKPERLIAPARQFIRYNSRMPIVVYVPDGMDVVYRVISTQGDFTVAERGGDLTFGGKSVDLVGQAAKPLILQKQGQTGNKLPQVELD